MNTEKALEELEAAMDAIEAAKSSIESAVALLRGHPPQILDETADSEAQCKWCGKPIHPGDKVNREIHVNCYNLAYSRVRAREVTWDELEQRGVVGTKGKSGKKRKPTPIDRVATDPEYYIPDPRTGPPPQEP